MKIIEKIKKLNCFHDSELINVIVSYNNFSKDDFVSEINDYVIIELNLKILSIKEKPIKKLIMINSTEFNITNKSSDLINEIKIIKDENKYILTFNDNLIKCEDVLLF